MFDLEVYLENKLDAEKNERSDEHRRSWSYRSDGIKISAMNDGLGTSQKTFHKSSFTPLFTFKNVRYSSCPN